MLSRAAKLLAILLLGVLLAELALQIGAWAVRRTGGRDETRWLRGVTRVVTLGDSNTYGLYVDAEEAWPKVLERTWNAAHAEPIQVINLAYPGTQSSQIAASIHHIMQTFRPDVVTVLAGINDFWFMPVGYETQPPPSVRFGIWAQENIRLYRAFLLASRSRFDESDLEIYDPWERAKWEEIIDKRFREDKAPVDPERYSDAIRYKGKPLGIGSGGSNFMEDERPGIPAALAALPGNLEFIVDAIGEYDAIALAMTYPSNYKFYRQINQAVYRELSTRDWFRNVAAQFMEHCEEPECPALFFPDQHPRPEGHRLLGEYLAGELAALLEPGGGR